MSNFYTLLTRVGAALHANAQVNQTTVPWTHMRLGDGNGAAVVPTENQTSLVRQVHTLQITDISVHPDNPNWVIAEAVVPSDVGGWTVREAAIYGGADGNTCIAVGNYPETYKPVLAEGAGREMVMRMVVEISSVATVKLQIDPAVAIASRAWVESLVATPAKAGLVKLATVAESKAQVRSDRAVTPEGLGAALAEHGGLPRFTPYVWGGLADAMPAGDTQSSGQQLLDLMYPDMRAEVVATQFTCPENEWQADPYKRVTHWSLGDGVSWMRPPDKNCVQPGSLEGPFFAGGVDSANPLLGTAVLDTLASHTHSFNDQSRGGWHNVTSGSGLQAQSYGAPQSFNTDAFGGGKTQPRTWYGIWMIRMYGRVLNTGALDAAGLNVRMDMIDARVSSLESGEVRFDRTTTAVKNTMYTNLSGKDRRVEIGANLNAIFEFEHAGVILPVYDSSAGDTFNISVTIKHGESYRLSGWATLYYWKEYERA